MKHCLCIVVAMFFSFPAFSEDCPILDQTGTPLLELPLHTQLICHAAYAAYDDLDALVPRWVAYPLTKEHTVGCNGRKNNFHAEALLLPPPGPDGKIPFVRRATPSDYAATGYDIGHQMSAADAEWNAQVMSDTFSLANMAPQLPGLNRDGWEDLEQHVRAWAWERGSLIVFVGPVISTTDKTIGKDKVDVPTAFWKIIFDPATNEAIAFQMPQAPVAKGNLAPYARSIQSIEDETGIVFPLPPPIDKVRTAAAWPADIAGYNKYAKAACPAATP